MFPGERFSTKRPEREGLNDRPRSGIVDLDPTRRHQRWGSCENQAQRCVRRHLGRTRRREKMRRRKRGLRVRHQNRDEPNAQANRQKTVKHQASLTTDSLPSKTKPRGEFRAAGPAAIKRTGLERALHSDRVLHAELFATVSAAPAGRNRTVALGVLRDVGEIAGVEEEPNQVGVTVIEINVRVDARLKVVEKAFVGAGQAVVGDGLLPEALAASSAWE